jgi:hypothetical protein
MAVLEGKDPKNLTANQLENRLYSRLVEGQESDSSELDCAGGLRGYTMAKG